MLVSNRHELNACWVAKSLYVSYTTVFENISSFDSCEKSLFFFPVFLAVFILASCLNCGSSVSPLNIGNSQGSILITLSHLLGFIFHLSFSYQLYIDDLEFYISFLLYLLPHKLLNWDAPLNIYKLMISDHKNPIVYKQYSSTQPLLLILQACLLIFCIVHQTAALLT